MTEWNRKEIKEENPVEQAVSSRIEEIRTEKRGWKKWAAGTGAMACVLFLLSHVFFGLAVVEGSSMVPGYQDTGWEDTDQTGHWASRRRNLYRERKRRSIHRWG